jgi:hypothetical protein
MPSPEFGVSAPVVRGAPDAGDERIPSRSRRWSGCDAIAGRDSASAPVAHGLRARPWRFARPRWWKRLTPSGRSPNALIPGPPPARPRSQVHRRIPRDPPTCRSPSRSRPCTAGSASVHRPSAPRTRRLRDRHPPRRSCSTWLSRKLTHGSGHQVRMGRARRSRIGKCSNMASLLRREPAILEQLRPQRQTMLFSATLDGEVAAGSRSASPPTPSCTRSSTTRPLRQRRRTASSR